MVEVFAQNTDRTLTMESRGKASKPHIYTAEYFGNLSTLFLDVFTILLLAQVARKVASLSLLMLHPMWGQHKQLNFQFFFHIVVS